MRAVVPVGLMLLLLPALVVVADAPDAPAGAETREPQDWASADPGSERGPGDDEYDVQSPVSGVEAESGDFRFGATVGLGGGEQTSLVGVPAFRLVRNLQQTVAPGAPWPPMAADDSRIQLGPVTWYSYSRALPFVLTEEGLKVTYNTDSSDALLETADRWAAKPCGQAGSTLDAATGATLGCLNVAPLLQPWLPNLDIPNDGSVIGVFHGIEITADPSHSPPVRVEGLQGLAAPGADQLLPAVEAPLPFEEAALPFDTFDLSGQPLPPSSGVASSSSSSLLLGVDPDMMAVYVLAAGAGLVLLAIPLYRRLVRGKVLEHDVRERILGVVKAQPGIHESGLAKQLGISHTLAQYHVRMMAEFGLLEVKRFGGRKCLFATGALGRTEKTLLLAEQGRGAQVVDLVAAQPGIAQRDLARALGIRESSVKWHLDRLEQQGVVSVERGPEGKRVRLTPEVERARLASFERVAPEAGPVAPAPAAVPLAPVDAAPEPATA